ncbi:F0F1 ATP synthase subunit A [soil metagenome]
MDLNVHVELAAETLFKIGPVPVTNSMVTMWGVMAILILVFWLAARKKQAVPGKFQMIIELIVDFIKNLVISTAGPKLGRKIMPLIMGLFVFILFANLSGLLPGMGTIGEWQEPEHETAAVTTTGETTTEDSHESTEATTTDESHEETATDESHDAAAVTEEEDHGKVLLPYLRAPNADINMTLAMALIAIVTVQLAGIRAHGVIGRIKHMADPPFLLPIEIIGEVSRVVSLAARLFGNVFAGEVLLGVMFAFGESLKVAVIPFLFPVVFLFLEVLFSSIQAIVFSLLVLIYITLAAAGSHGHDEEDAHEPSHAPVAPGGAVAAHGVGD